MPLFLRTASGKWDGRERPAKIAHVDNAQRCACNRVQYRDVTAVEKFQNLSIRNANTNYRLQFYFFWTKVDHHRRLVIMRTRWRHFTVVLKSTSLKHSSSRPHRRQDGGEPAPKSTSFRSIPSRSSCDRSGLHN